MKEFNLKEYIAHPERKVVTRDGRDARIIYTDLDADGGPIVAIVTMANSKKQVLQFYENGKYYFSSDSVSEDDLFFAPNKKEGWVNIYYRAQAMICGLVYESEERAKQEIDKDKLYITTTKIEWEE